MKHKNSVHAHKPVHAHHKIHKQHKYFGNKQILIGLATLVVLASGIAFSRSEFLTSRIYDWSAIRPIGAEKGGNQRGGNEKGKGPSLNLSYFRDMFGRRTVSVVVSAVPSVVPTRVASNVSSKGGVSRVVSNVPTVIASAVASGVPVSAVAEKKLANKVFPAISEAAKRQAENADKQNNPSKYVVSNAIKAKLLKMYYSTHRR